MAIRISVPLCVSEDGVLILNSAGIARVQRKADEELVGLDDLSRERIELFNLNSPVEVRQRQLKRELDDLSLRTTPELVTVIANFVGATHLVADLNRNTSMQDLTRGSYIRRLFYANVITAFETFLSDLALALLDKDRSFIKNLATKYDNFSNEKVKLADLFVSGKTPEEIIKDKTRDLVFHNLPVASNIYRAAFDITFPDFSELSKAVDNRHDIIHRNGFKNYQDSDEDESSNSAINLEEDDIKELINICREFSLDIIEQALQRL